MAKSTTVEDMNYHYAIHCLPQTTTKYRMKTDSYQLRPRLRFLRYVLWTGYIQTICV